MTPLVIEGIGSLLRWALALGAGYLVNSGVWTQEEAIKYSAAFALALLSLGLSLYQKYVARTKLVTALAMPTGTTEAVVERTIAQGEQAAVSTPKDVKPRLEPAKP